MRITVIHKNAKHRCEEARFYIGRPSPLGNPFPITPANDRETVIKLYEEWLITQLEDPHSEASREMDRIYTIAREGHDVVLACWCSPLPCHGDVIKKMLEQREEAEYVPTFFLIVAGGRTFNDYELMKKKLDALLVEKAATHSIIIISGTARGADTLGERYAEEREYEYIRMPAEWNTYGKRAGYLRNVAMANAADAAVVFWNGKTERSGSKMMIDIAKEKKLPTKVIRYQD